MERLRYLLLIGIKVWYKVVHDEKGISSMSDCPGRTDDEASLAGLWQLYLDMIILMQLPLVVRAYDKIIYNYRSIPAENATAFSVSAMVLNKRTGN